jgi:2-polyprenyl-3-methyl-5-hydroxy-6-metoxy-1,4-benzoquinol methylase
MSDICQPVISSYECFLDAEGDGVRLVNWNTMPPRKPYKIFLMMPNNGQIMPPAVEASINASRKHKVLAVPGQFGDIQHNFNMMVCTALNARAKEGWTHIAMVHADIGAQSYWLDTLLEEMDRVGADLMTTVMAIKDDRFITTTGIRYRGIPGCRRFTVRETDLLPETFSIADTEEPDQILAINTGLWVARFPVGGWPDKFADGEGFKTNCYIKWRNGQAEPTFDSEDWIFSEWAHLAGMKVYATTKVLAFHRGGKDYYNKKQMGTWYTEQCRPQRPLGELAKQRPDPQITVETEFPVAVDSLDHTMPLGTIHDNFYSPGFNRKLFECVSADRCRVLDLGCSGGGFVRSILERGGFAIGIEGSDLSLKARRAEWATIPNYLFTADATKPFAVKNCTPEPVKFNVITAWEFFEHIAEKDLDEVIGNIVRHAEDGAILVGSISQNEEPHHRTAKPKDWWITRLGGLHCSPATEFVHAPDLEAHFGHHLVRGEPDPTSKSFSIAFRIVDCRKVASGESTEIGRLTTASAVIRRSGSDD